MKTEIIDSQEITRKQVIYELTYPMCELTKEEVDEYLDILSAIDNGESVYNLITNKGEYLLFVKGNSITDTKCKKCNCKKSK
jgi:hypothetical protein